MYHEACHLGSPHHFFHQVGPDIHLETKGIFYLPDVQPEHRERLFKNFPSKRCNQFSIGKFRFLSFSILLFLIIRVNDMRFPANLEAFINGKDGLKIASSDPSASKEIVEETSKEEQDPPGKPEFVSSSPPRSTSPCTICPLCSISFPQEVITFRNEYLRKMIIAGAWRARSKMLWSWRGRRSHHCQLPHLWPGTAGEDKENHIIEKLLWFCQLFIPPGWGSCAACSYLCSSNFWQLIVFAFHTIQIFTCDILSISYVLYLTMLWKRTVLAKQPKETFSYSCDLNSRIRIAFKLSPAVTLCLPSGFAVEHLNWFSLTKFEYQICFLWLWLW